MFETRARGIARTLLRDGRPVVAELRRCVVRRVATTGGKTYATLDITRAEGDVALLDEVDRAAHAQEPLMGFSPLWGDKVVAKLTPATRYEDAAGELADVPWDLPVDGAVDVRLRFGAFTRVGYCWLVDAVRPAAVVTPTAG